MQMQSFGIYNTKIQKKKSSKQRKVFSLEMLNAAPFFKKKSISTLFVQMRHLRVPICLVG